MRRGRQKLNQAGFSLVELIVVVLIMGILSGVSIVGINYVNSMNAHGAAGKLASFLERARIQTISAKGDIEVTLVQEGTKYYGRILEDGAELDKVEIGNTALTINAYTGAPGTPGAPIPVGTTGVTFSYDEANGSFADTCNYTLIEVIGKNTEQIRLIPSTGRSFLK